MIAFAALTGVLLFVASIAAGWFENWITYRSLPEAIAKSRRLKKLLGTERAKRIADKLVHDANSMAGSVSLGFLLGFVPMLGTMFALPLDVRHVTLSTGSLVFAGCALGTDYLKTGDFIGRRDRYSHHRRAQLRRELRPRARRRLPRAQPLARRHPLGREGPRQRAWAPPRAEPARVRVPPRRAASPGN